ncbi:hypothetical protein ACIHCQ_21420 [Streptomyces sp. NPDC052236]|uniref:hypothetical protein n=1 Tax=Streptomyces sp. NPDC052236 TaxID=3365686 RepID=UPI0037D6E54C
MKEKLTKVLPETLEVIEDPETAPKKRATYTRIVEGITTTLKTIEDPKTPPKEQATYTRIVEGITTTLKTIEDPKTPPKEQATYTRILEGITYTLENIQNPPLPQGNPPQEKRAHHTRAMELATTTPVTVHAPNLPPAERATYMRIVETITYTVNKIQTLPQEERASFARVAELTTAALVAVQAPKTRPKDPEDQLAIEKTVKETGNTLAATQEPKASQKERNEAKKKLDQRTRSLQNSQFLELMKEVKRHKAPAACIKEIKSRTLQTGWSDGSLWGLGDSLCAATVAEGARQDSGRWSALFECVQRHPFSTCVVHIPKD